FEIDNNCIPDNTTQRVRTFWANTALEVDEEAPLAQKFEVYGNYPNPFNPSTQIKFATEKSSDVTITIYSILGQEMIVLQNGILNAGTYNISWFGTDRYGNKVPSGVYFYEVRSDNRIQKGKMLLLK
ncbi:MAG: T9SS type A sorting domain-containing protein, partial [Candidatus Marinimicrobia bacterium]|nr:T9SS type A sorting domain-containing protein [Candidatus Neomarinimicrobiota bacterium]